MIIITIPAYNEEKTISNVISEIKSTMDKTRYKYSILVVNDGSVDNTKELAQRAGAIVYSHPRNYGLAETFKTEIKECLRQGAKIIVHTDADCQYLASDIPKLIEQINCGYDLVLGSRFLGKIEEMPFMKKLGNKAFSRVISRLTKTRITDCQTGFRAFTREVAEKIPIISNFTYTQEQVIRAINAKFKIKEVPVYFAKRKEGKSRLFSNPFNYAVRAWINLFRLYRDYEPLKFFGLFGLAFISLGMLIGVWLFYLFIKTGKVDHIPLAMLTILLIIAGIQIAIFGFLADMKKN